MCFIDAKLNRKHESWLTDIKSRQKKLKNSPQVFIAIGY